MLEAVPQSRGSSDHVIQNSSLSVQSGEYLVSLVVAITPCRDNRKWPIGNSKWPLLGEAGSKTLKTFDKYRKLKAPLTCDDVFLHALGRRIWTAYPNKQYRFECLHAGLHGS